MTAMRILIVGAGSFVGRHLAGRLAADGLSVTVAGRSPRRLARLLPGLTPIACDLARDDAADWLLGLVLHYAGPLAPIESPAA